MTRTNRCDRSRSGIGSGVGVEVGVRTLRTPPHRNERTATALVFRRPRDPVLHTAVPRVQVLPFAQIEPVRQDPRHAGQGPDAGQHQPFHVQGPGRLPLYGLLHLLRVHGHAGDRPGQGRPQGPARQGTTKKKRFASSKTCGQEEMHYLTLSWRRPGVSAGLRHIDGLRRGAEHG